MIFLTNDPWYQKPDFSKCKYDYSAFAFAGNAQSASKIIRADERSGRISGGESPVLNCPQIEICWKEWSELNYWCCVAKV